MRIYARRHLNGSLLRVLFGAFYIGRHVCAKSSFFFTCLRELAVGEVFKERALPDRTVADQYQPELIIENRLYHFGSAGGSIRLLYMSIIEHVRRRPSANHRHCAVLSSTHTEQQLTVTLIIGASDKRPRHTDSLPLPETVQTLHVHVLSIARARARYCARCACPLAPRVNTRRENM